MNTNQVTTGKVRATAMKIVEDLLAGRMDVNAARVGINGMRVVTDNYRHEQMERLDRVSRSEAPGEFGARVLG